MTVTETLIKDLVEKHGRNRNSLMPVLQGVVHDGFGRDDSYGRGRLYG